MIFYLLDYACIQKAAQAVSWSIDIYNKNMKVLLQRLWLHLHYRNVMSADNFSGTSSRVCTVWNSQISAIIMASIHSLYCQMQAALPPVTSLLRTCCPQPPPRKRILHIFTAGGSIRQTWHPVWSHVRCRSVLSWVEQEFHTAHVRPELP